MMLHQFILYVLPDGLYALNHVLYLQSLWERALWNTSDTEVKARIHGITKMCSISTVMASELVNQLKNDYRLFVGM